MHGCINPFSKELNCYTGSIAGVVLVASIGAVVCGVLGVVAQSGQNIHGSSFFIALSSRNWIIITTAGGVALAVDSYWIHRLRQNSSLKKFEEIVEDFINQKDIQKWINNYSDLTVALRKVWYSLDTQHKRQLLQDNVQSVIDTVIKESIFDLNAKKNLSYIGCEAQEQMYNTLPQPKADDLKQGSLVIVPRSSGYTLSVYQHDHKGEIYVEVLNNKILNTRTKYVPDQLLRLWPTDEALPFANTLSDDIVNTLAMQWSYPEVDLAEFREALLATFQNS